MLLVAGLFESPALCTEVYSDVRNLAGVELAGNEEPVITEDAEEAYYTTPQMGTEVVVGTAGGTGAGGIVGAMTGWIGETVGLITLDAELVLATAASPVLLALDTVLTSTATLGAGAGFVSGGLLGAHAGWRQVETAATAFRRGVAEGGSMLLVRVRNRTAARKIARHLRGCGAARVQVGMDWS